MQQTIEHTDCHAGVHRRTVPDARHWVTALAPYREPSLACSIRQQIHPAPASRESGRPIRIFPVRNREIRAMAEAQADQCRTVKRPNTLAGLIEKRREIAGKIEHHQRILNELIIDLDHVDHTIRLFDPDCDVTLAKPKQFPPRHQAFRGEMQRFALGALRAASQPITSLEVAIEVVKGRGLDLIRKRVGACLFSLKAKGIARDVPTAGQYKG
jgi:hypothetical protein